MSYPLPINRRASVLLMIPAVVLSLCLLAHAQEPAPNQTSPQSTTPAKSDTPSTPAVPAASPQEEMSTHDNPATFHVRVNLVLARVVVRDSHGKVVTNLHKEDFLVFDNRKEQVVSSFSTETPKTNVATPTETATSDNGPPADTEKVAAARLALPQRFVAMVFDDGHMSLEDTSFVRDAASRLFGALAPSDRVGIFSSSGQT